MVARSRTMTSGATSSRARPRCRSGGPRPHLVWSRRMGRTVGRCVEPEALRYRALERHPVVDGHHRSRDNRRWPPQPDCLTSIAFRVSGREAFAWALSILAMLRGTSLGPLTGATYSSRLRPPSPRGHSIIMGPSISIRAEVAELADALDSNSSEAHTSCGFDPRLRHPSLKRRNPLEPRESTHRRMAGQTARRRVVWVD